MAPTLVCWRCGASVEDLPRPFARLAECPACRAQLHVCRMCTFFAPGVARSCREPVAEDVQDKERANFCGYFQARADAYRPADAAAATAARAELDGLFGLPSAPLAGGRAGRPDGDASREALARLFGLGDDTPP